MIRYNNWAQGKKTLGSDFRNYHQRKKNVVSKPIKYKEKEFKKNKILYWEKEEEIYEDTDLSFEYKEESEVPSNTDKKTNQSNDIS